MANDDDYGRVCEGDVLYKSWQSAMDSVFPGEIDFCICYALDTAIFGTLLFL